MRNILIAFFAVCIFVSCNSAGSRNLGESQAEIEISSSCPQLDTFFEWAKAKALSYVMTGKSGPVNRSESYDGDGDYLYLRCYQAGYPFRSAFYSRDFCHQCAGAHLLGLDEENFSMLKAFAASAEESRKWFPLWSLNFNGSPFILDYKDDGCFVREVPAVFELVQKAYEAYSWTGDKRYLNDDTLLVYYEKAVTEFISSHDSVIHNGIAEGSGDGNIFHGTATYNEDMYDRPLLEAGDGLGSQYQAYRAYSELLYAKGKTNESSRWSEKADSLKRYFDEVWSSPKYGYNYISGYDKDKKPYTCFGKEPTWFIALKRLISDNKRGIAFLDFLESSLDDTDNIPCNIEAVTYLPDVFFPYGRLEEGWHWMKYIMDSVSCSHSVIKTGANGNYPEISYTFISDIVENLAGIVPDAPDNALSATSSLPEEISFLNIKNVKMGGHLFDISLKENKSVCLYHTYGRNPLHFQCRFYGNHPVVIVNGRKIKSDVTVYYGKKISSVTVDVAPRQNVCIKY
jgi:hypothetical protein